MVTDKIVSKENKALLTMKHLRLWETPEEKDRNNRIVNLLLSKGIKSCYLLSNLDVYIDFETAKVANDILKQTYWNQGDKAKSLSCSIGYMFIDNGELFHININR